MKPLPLVILVAVFATILGLAVWMVGGDDTGDDAGDLEGLASESTVAPVSHGDLESSAPREVASLEVDLPPVERVVDDAPTAIPESYRAALGGLTGRVIEEDGSPVVDLPVALGAGGPATFQWPSDGVFMDEFPALEPLLGETRTDEAGRFTLTDIEPRVLGALLLDAGGPRATFRVLQQTPTSGEVTDIGDIVMAAGVTFRGRVVDERDEPIAGARVRMPELPPMVLQIGIADVRVDGAVLVEEESLDKPFVVQAPPELRRYEKLLPFPTTYTEADGTFELVGVKTGSPSIVVDDGVHQTLTDGPLITGPAGGVRELGDVVMLDGETIVVAVYDDQNKPVVGAEVLAGNKLAVAPVSLLKGHYKTGPDGRVAVPGLRSGTVNAVARRETRDAFSVGTGVPTGGGAEVRVVLEGLRTLTLDITNDEGEVVPGAEIYGRVLPDEDADEVPDMFLRPRSLADNLSVDEDGRYVLEGLSAAVHELVIRAPGHAVFRDAYALQFSDATESVQLEKALSHEFLAFESDGETPVEHALVIVYEASNEKQVTLARTDADGHAEVSGMVAGDYRVELSHPGLSVVEETFSVPSEEPTTILMPVGGIVSGIVVDESTAPPEQPMMVFLEREGRGLPGNQMPRMTMTDLDGLFAFHDVDPGEYEVSVRQPLSDFDLMNWWEPMAMSPLAEEDVTVVSAEEEELYLVMGSATAGIETGMVHGRLMVNGRPAEGWKIRTWGEIRRSATVEPDGSFDMGQLAAGNVTLMIDAPDSTFSGGGVEMHTFELAVDTTENVQIDLTTGQVRGRVFSERTNQPVEGAQVVITHHDPERGNRGWWGGRRQVALAQGDGSYEFPNVVEGRYTVSAESDGYSRSTTAPFDVPPLGMTNAPDVRLFGAITVSGPISFEGVDEMPDWVWLNASDENGNRIFAQVDREKRRYTFDDMAPGTWTIQANADFGGKQLEPTTVVVTHATDALSLHFNEAPPPEPQEVQVLQELGYVGEG